MAKILSEKIKTKNIKSAIEEFAKNNSLKLSMCDFKLSNVETYLRDNAEKEFKLLNQDIKEEYSDKQRVVNEHTEFFQYYDIIVYEQTKCKIKLKYTLEFGEYSTNPKIIISPQSHIPYQLYKPKELLSLLFRELNKIKAKHSIIIGLFDESMIKNLKILVKYIYAKKFLKRVKIPLFDGIKPELSLASKLVYKFKEKENHNQVIEVEKNEILIEYYKPKFGKNGLNCHGEEVGVKFANNKEDLKQEVDLNSIYIKDTEDKRIYLSKIKGFVHFSEERISVDHKLKMSGLSRVQDSVASDEDNNIEVVIDQKDTNKDSIGEGVELVSETINVSGHIGANSILEAINLNIDGATHQDSKQFAKEAKINRHKGTLRCHNAKVNLLEGGEIHATNAEVETCLGGSIYAQNVKISHVKSNLKVFASESISIKLITGEDNRLKINYRDVPILMSKIKFIKEDIEELRFSLEEAKRHNLSIVNGIVNEIKKLKNEILSIENSARTAKITIEKPLRGLNNIIYTIDNENEIVFKTQAIEYTPFYLEITEDKITLHPTDKSITLEN
jgi:hypothetical protein